MRHSFFDATLISAPAIPAALLVMLGLSGAAESAIILLLGAAATLFFLIARQLLKGVLSAGALRVCAGLLLGVLVIMAGFLRLHAPATRLYPGIPPHAVVALEGRVLEDLRPGSSPYRVIPVEVHRLEDRQSWRSEVSGRVTLIWQGGEYLQADGRRIIPVRGDMIRITGLAGIERGSPAPLIFTTPENITLAASAGPPAVRRTIRDAIRSRLARLDPRGGAMIPALLLGDRGALSPELSDAVRAAGAAHVLALSGMHLGVLAVILHLGPLRFLPRRYRDLVVLPVLAGYVWIAGWIPSLVRAMVLITVATTARVRRRPVPVPLLLARTVVATGIIAPRIVGNVGFQLSLLALAGIVLLAPLLLDWLGRFLPRPLAGYVGVTLAAMMATAPLSLGIFGTVYPAGIVLAGVLSALIVLQMWGGIAFMVFATTPVVGTVLAALIRANALLVERTARLGYLFPVIRSGPHLLIAAALASAGILAIVVRRRLVLRCPHEPRFDF
ncbi:MAG: ComEC family competence protein [Spirochaetaceae bacterium]|nr:MAG: ComEC family competence protein [Spirochaetaceae bacterium]